MIKDDNRTIRKIRNCFVPLILALAMIFPAAAWAAPAAEEAEIAGEIPAAKESEFAEESETAAEIQVPFFVLGFGHREYSFPYSDEYFTGSGTEFSRDIAKASMGLLASAFREKPDSGLANQNETYLKAAGFQDIHAFGYDQSTGVDTLSGVIAHKKIGDFTLIAAAACGQGYGKEWGGNLQVGTGERHEGFQTGAQVMEQEIDAYLQEQQLEGELKLWITGFSRAAAVGNLTAADAIASGRFSDVFGYLYATPRNTRNPVAYPGIFNIVGKYDPVPQVPLESWGFGRYGTDLYTPAAETDVNYNKLYLSVNKTCFDIVGDFFRFNPELNDQIHLILEFLGELFPTSEEYVDKMQDAVMGIWQEANPDQIEPILISVFSQLEDLDARQEHSTKAFINYLEYLFAQRVADNRRSTEYRDIFWSDEQGMGANLFREHSPYIYMSWIFSDLSDEELFEGTAKTRRLSILGDVDVEVWKDDLYLEGVDRNGAYIDHWDVIKDYDIEEMTTDVFMQRAGQETRVCLPFGQNFELLFSVPERTDVIYYDVVYTPDHTYGMGETAVTAVLDAGQYRMEYSADGERTMLEAVDGNVIRQDSYPLVYSPVFIMELRSSSNEHLTVQNIFAAFVFIFFIILLLLFICLVIFIVHCIRRKKHGPYSPLYVIIPHLLLFLLFMVITRNLTEDLYMITIARVIGAAVCMLILFLLSLRGLLRNRNLPNLLITAGILGLGFVNCLLYQKSSLVSASGVRAVLYFAAMIVLFVAASLTFRIGRKKKEFPASENETAQ